MDYESMTTEELREILRQDAHAEPEDMLPTDTVLEICQILTARNPVKTDVAAAYRRFVKYYMPRD